MELARTFSRLTFMFGNRHWQPQNLTRECLFLSIAVSRPDLGACKRLWEHSLAACERLGDDVDSAVLAGKFRFGLSQIQGCAGRGGEPGALALAQGLGGSRGSDVSAACRAQSSPKLGALAQKIEPKYTWNEIALPHDNLAQLKELGEQARRRHQVYGEWGFEPQLSPGKGLNALFAGPPGTGRRWRRSDRPRAGAGSLQDRPVAVRQQIHRRNREEPRSDLPRRCATPTRSCSSTKPMRCSANAPRSRTRTTATPTSKSPTCCSKSRNIRGPVILSTNLKLNLDEAFLRRMHFIIEFPFPDHEDRRQIWRACSLTKAPLADEVDFDVLAREIRLAGGNIKNIALAAGFTPGDGQVIQMPHLWHAARREHQKLGRTWENAKATFYRFAGGVFTMQARAIQRQSSQTEQRAVQAQPGFAGQRRAGPDGRAGILLSLQRSHGNRFCPADAGSERCAA